MILLYPLFFFFSFLLFNLSLYRENNNRMQSHLMSPRVRLHPPEGRRFLPEGLQSVIHDGSMHLAGVCIQVWTNVILLLACCADARDSGCIHDYSSAKCVMQ